MGDAVHPIEIIQGGESEPLKASLEAKMAFASRTGTKYYYVWCSGAGRIKEANKVFFTSGAAAREAGYEKAKNCPGD